MVDGGPNALMRTAELLHEAVAKSDIPVVPTVSIGAASAPTPKLGVHDVVRALIERADAAMYRAKHAGGNQTVTADDAVPADD